MKVIDVYTQNHHQRCELHGCICLFSFVYLKKLIIT